MKALSIILGLLFVLSCSRNDATSGIKYYGADNREVEIQYNTWFEIDNNELNLESKIERDFLRNNEQIINKRLKDQVLFLYGTFSQHTSPTDFYSWPATIRESQKTRISKLDFEKNNVKIHYSYKDLGVAYDGLLEGQNKRNLEFFLPNNPSTIYKLSMPSKPKIDPKSKLPIHPCTDEHDFSESAFWYYWNPGKKGCPRKIRNLIHKVTASFKMLGQTTDTYPEYDRLSKDWANERIYTFYFGIDRSLKNPNDLGRKTYNDFNNLLLNLEKTKGIFTKIESGRNKTLFSAKDALGKSIKIRAFIADTDSKDHDQLAKQSILNSSLFVFSGHSYEGFYFNPDRVFNDGELGNDKYQIIFMNSCTSYSYYHSNLFKAKSTSNDVDGTKSLDIVTNAIGSPILADVKFNNRPSLYGAEFILLMELLGYDKYGNKREVLSSWQNIMAEIESDVGYELSSLSQVLGDHDNIYSPYK